MLEPPIVNISIQALAPDVFQSCVLFNPTPSPSQPLPDPGPVGGEIFFPAAPGISFELLPVAPTVIDTSPDRVIGCIESVADNPQGRLDALFPAAIEEDGVIEKTTGDFWVRRGGEWQNVGPTPGPTIVADKVLPVWNETVIVEAITGLGLVVASFNYALAVLTEVDPISIVAGINVRRQLWIKVPSVTTGTTAPVPKISSGASVVATLSAIQVDPVVPVVSTGIAIRPQSITVTISALTPPQAGPNFTSIEPPIKDLHLIANPPTISIGAAIRVNLIDISTSYLEPLVSGGASIVSPTSGIIIQTQLPDNIGPDALAINVVTASIFTSTQVPAISTGKAIAPPKASVVASAQAPDIIIDSYFSSMLAQIYAWDRDFRVDWWGD
jgi:hypothetical protein